LQVAAVDGTAFSLKAPPDPGAKEIISEGVAATDWKGSNRQGNSRKSEPFSILLGLGWILLDLDKFGFGLENARRRDQDPAFQPKAVEYW